jgi:hypothetical protein
MYWGSPISSFVNIGGVVAEYISPNTHMEGGSHKSVRENMVKKW